MEAECKKVKKKKKSQIYCKHILIRLITGIKFINFPPNTSSVKNGLQGTQGIHESRSGCCSIEIWSSIKKKKKLQNKLLILKQVFLKSFVQYKYKITCVIRGAENATIFLSLLGMFLKFIRFWNGRVDN